MVIEKEILPFWVWFSENVGPFQLTLLALLGLSLLAGFLAGAMRHGPVDSIRLLVRTLVTGIVEFFQISPRRVYAIAKLSFVESVRRRVFFAFLVFFFLLMFASWFLDRGSEHPARLYMTFVMTSTSYLVILLAIFLSAFSIPNDVKHKTIFTVVTKPVRAWEIVVGRMLGFCALGTLLLAVMCFASLVFVSRGVQHSHAVDPSNLVENTVEVDEETTIVEKTGPSERNRNHRHEVTVRKDGKLSVVPMKDHTHGIVADDGNVRLTEQRGMLQARVPILGDLRFLDRSGNIGKGVNPGYEWQYRKYIEGGTLSAAIWRFKNIDEEQFPDGLPLEMTLRVFRTYKGLIETGIMGQIEVVKPAPLDEEGIPVALDAGVRSEPYTFTAVDYEAYERRIPRKLTAIYADGTEREVDLFRELVNSEGEVEIWIRCLDRAQYLGMAEADLYLRAENQPFSINFVKGFVSIWFQMVVVICFGVTFSTFLNGAVAMLATLSAMVMGFNKQSVFDVASGELPGGGPVESFVRMLWQLNQMVEMDDTPLTAVIKGIDGILMHVIQAVSYAMPNCGKFNTSNFVAYGYDVPPALISQHFAITFAYFIVLSMVSYFFFKTREIAA